MYKGLLHAHSGLRYLLLLVLIIVLFVSLIGWLRNKNYNQGHRTQIIGLLIIAHLQLLLGLGLYFLSPFVVFSEETMSNDIIRYWTLEHVLLMVVAVVFITISRISSKHIEKNNIRFKRIFIYNLLALIFILSAIFMSGRGII